MSERFARFTITLSRLNKNIQKLKTEGMGRFGLKAVDTLCLYQLSVQGEMSFSEVAEHCDLDAALVSRTLRELVKNGIVAKSGAPGKYNATYRLTPMGEERFQAIRHMIQTVQDRADEGIDKRDLRTFYRVLDQLTRNFEQMAHQNELFPAEEEQPQTIQEV